MIDYSQYQTLEEWIVEQRDSGASYGLVFIAMVRDIEDFLEDKPDDSYDIYDDGYSMTCQVEFSDLVAGLDDWDVRPWQLRNFYDRHVLDGSPDYNDGWQMTIF